MNPTKRKKIQKIAEAIHYKLGMQIPVNFKKLKTLAENLGGKIIPMAFSEAIDAKIEKSGDDFKIFVNSNKPNTRTNFSIAHEFGHLFLHMGFIFSPDRWNKVERYTDSVYYRLGHDTEELEANEFAAAFLMPEAKYRQVVDEFTENGLCDLPKVAKRFAVSEPAALNRGRWLGIFSWE